MAWAGLWKIQNLHAGKFRTDSYNHQFRFFTWVSDFNRIGQAIRRCRQIQAFKYGKSLHSQLIKSGSWNDIFIANNLIAMYSDFMFPCDAHRVFDEMPVRNVVSWTTLISAYTRGGEPSEALKIFNRMSEFEFEAPNSFTFSAALKACAMAENMEQGKLIHQCVCKAQLQSDTILMNTVLDMYIKCGSLDEAQKVFDDLSLRNSTSWNTMIAGYSKEGQMEEAMDLFCQMPKPDIVTWNTVIAGFASKESPEALEFVTMTHKEGFQLDQFTFPCALKTCGCLRSLTMGKQIHCYMVKSGFESGCITGSSLIDMYAKCGKVDEAMKLFNECLKFQGSAHDKLALCNSMISGYVINEHNSEALDLASQIHGLGVRFDSYTFSSILKVCINLIHFRYGIQVHGLVVTSGYQLDSVVGSVLIDLYAKCGKIEDALRLFRRLPIKDIVSWSGVITGCTQQGSNLLAFSLFREMVYLNLEVDQFIVSSVLKACSSLAGLEGGKQVHAFCVKSGYEFEGVTATSLIDMYSKCGEIDDGLAVFKGVTERDTVCWTGIIAGCGQNGRAEEATGFFQEMLKSGVKPNEITFLGVLSACRHAGLVENARMIFRSMGVEHGLVPRLEHYCCMVDLLGRAGYFKEAERLIADMPYEPDETIWGSLLGACGIHKNVELGKLVVEHLLTISPDDVSVYVTLSNVFAGLAMWDDSTKLREVVRQMGMKESGISWIEVRD
ncbi:pentatricopeptide repeat (PPR-like) superfamily protein [Tasmannia lanceolata]|uniref:pentatricopeptide repeat (PPR-like) superfamily protein n=1 Tax=Tasmannia lanceolata TaxID=3420 RepID=UPI004063DF7F